MATRPICFPLSNLDRPPSISDISKFISRIVSTLDIKGYSIACHYIKEDENEILSLNKEIRKIIALPEGSALYIKNKEIKLIGSQQAIIFENSKKTILKIGQKL